MPDAPLASALRIVDEAVRIEEEEGMPPGTLVSALFTAAAATLVHHFGWDGASLVDAVADLVDPPPL